jgi:hypothetical protein
MATPDRQSYSRRIDRWRAARRFSRLWREQRRVADELRRAYGTPEERSLSARLDAIDEQRHDLAHALGGEYPLLYEQGLIGGPFWFGTEQHRRS